MQIYTIQTSKMSTNTYIVENNGEVFAVDPGGDAAAISDKIKETGGTLCAILLTHVHFDHIGAVAELCRSFEGVTVFVHRLDAPKIFSRENMGFALGVEVEPFTPDVLLSGGETLSVAGLPVKVIHTPGHTDGGVCYLVGDTLFSGDTLFCGTYGRTDLFGGDFAQIKNSIINKLFRLKGDYRVLPGHGRSTALSDERRLNGILSDFGEGVRITD